MQPSSQHSASSSWMWQVSACENTSITTRHMLIEASSARDVISRAQGSVDNCLCSRSLYVLWHVGISCRLNLQTANDGYTSLLLVSPTVHSLCVWFFAACSTAGWWTHTTIRPHGNRAVLRPPWIAPSWLPHAAANMYRMHRIGATAVPGTCVPHARCFNTYCSLWRRHDPVSCTAC